MGLFSKKPPQKIDVPPQADHVLTSPLTGRVVPLSELPDETFATGVLGDGIGIAPTEGALYAPADGTIENLFSTLHAVCMTTTSGAELLLHIGKDTVALKGKGFTAHCKTGDRVSRGDLLVSFDLKAIEKAGYSSITPLCVSNSDQFSLAKTDATEIKAGEILITLGG